MFKKGGTGYYLVKTKKVYQEKTGVLGLDGKELVSDVTFAPEKRVVNYGEVMEVPVSYGSHFVSQRAVGAPGYGPLRIPDGEEDNTSTDLYASAGGLFEFKFSSDIQEILKRGDKIYFNRRTLMKKANFVDTYMEGKDKVFVHKVPVESIFCSVTKAGKIKMFGSYVLIEPIYEEWKDILRPTYYPFPDKNGKRIRRPEKEWIQTKVAPEADNLRGVVKKVGLPLRGDTCSIKMGMTVAFRPIAGVYRNIEGKEYMIMRQNQILCEIVNT